jgi:hypothetical protein
MSTVTQEPDTVVEETAAEPKPRWRVVVGWVLTVLAAAFFLGALVLPNRPTQLTPLAFVRIPVEALLGAVFVLLLPVRAVRWGKLAVALGGVVLGLVTLKKLFDIGFYSVLDRSFDPVSDWPLVADAANYVGRSYGKAGEVGAEIAAVLIVVGVLTLMALSAVRLAGLAVRYRRRATGTVAVLGVAWVACFALGAQLVPAVSVASRNAAGTALYGAVQVRDGLRDRAEFAKEANQDVYRNTPGSQLFPALKGKDVLITFVESYGVTALADPGVDAVLDNGTKQLAQDGYVTRSAFMSSPTFGGGSWLAHGTLLSGLWIDSQQRYRSLVSSDRFTMSAAFARAGWRTVCVMPATNSAWPEANFFGYDKVYDTRNLGYKGPAFTFSSEPDQFTLGTLQRNELGAGHQPVFAELDLLSSHIPWSSVPQLIDWNALGDGSVFRDTPRGDSPPDVRGKFLGTIRYTLSTVISYIEHYVDENTLFVFLGDHQPAPAVSGPNAAHNVPVTIVAKDPTLLDRVASWGWQDGLHPGAHAPLWSMGQFRDKFMAAFGSTPAAH